MERKTIKEPEREIPVVRDIDVAIVGGGTGGVVAAIAAARVGADTLLIERYGRLGGYFTWGWVTKPQGAIIGGIPGEIWERVIKYGGAIKVPGSWQQKMISRFYYMSPSDPITVERVYFEMVEEAGVKMMLNSLGVDAVVIGNEVKGVIVENKSGRQAILAKVVVDVSGEGDIAAKAGAPFEVGRIRDHKIETYQYKKDGRTEPMTIMFRVGDVDILKYIEYQKKANMSNLPDKVESLDDVKYTVHGGILYAEFTKDPKELGEFPKANCGIKTGRGKHEVFVNATRVTNVLAFDADAVTGAELQARKNVYRIEEFLKKYVPGFENSYIIDTAITMQPREARRFIGEYMLTEQDLRSGAKFKDTVARVFAPLDIHQPDGTGGYGAQFPEYDVPYRCLVTKNIDNLLVAGRQISADHYAHGSTRDEAVCMYSGQAAGAAAALSALTDTVPRRLNVKQLQSTLQEWGTILFESVFERIREMYPEQKLKEEYSKTRP